MKNNPFRTLLAKFNKTKGLTIAEFKVVCLNYVKDSAAFDRIYAATNGHPCSLCNTLCKHNYSKEVRNERSK